MKLIEAFTEIRQPVGNEVVAYINVSWLGDHPLHSGDRICISVRSRDGAIGEITLQRHDAERLFESCLKATGVLGYIEERIRLDQIERVTNMLRRDGDEKTIAMIKRTSTDAAEGKK